MDLDEIADAADDLEEDEAPPTTKRGRGRPRGSGRRGVATETTITKRVLTDEDEGDGDEEVSQTFAALFEEMGAKKNSVARIRITRVEPDEGLLGYINDMSATEDTIKERYGGGRFRIDGLSESGRYVKSKTLKIAGDPVFVSEAEENQWRKSRGLPPRGAPVGQTAPQGLTAQEVLAIVNAEAEKRREEEQRRAEERRKLEQEVEEKRRREEREWKTEREREAREWEERKRKEEREFEERRRKDEIEREDRRRREQMEAQQQQQLHMQQMLAIVKQSSDQAIQIVKAQVTAPQANQNNSLVEAVKVVALIKDAFAGEGGGEEDTVQTLLKNLPAMLNGAGNAIGGAIREFKQGGAPTLPAQSASPLALLPPGSPLGAKVEELVTNLAARGHDPEKVLTAIVDQANAALDKKTQAPAQRPVQPVAATPAQPPQAGTIVTAPTPAAPTPVTRPSNKPIVTAGRTARGAMKLSIGAPA